MTPGSMFTRATGSTAEPSYDGIRQRDAMVLRHFRARGIPVATVIGGGYGTDIDEVAFRHSLVFHAAAAGFPVGLG